MPDFNKTIKQNTENGVLLCAHRGSSSANIPCNTMAAFKAALLQHADMIELDVAKSRDGELFVFHPGMEPAHLHTLQLIKTRSAKSVNKLHYINQDDCKTELKIEKLEDVLDFLKGKCYINVDKFWFDIPSITKAIRKCGVEKQVIVKTPDKAKYYNQIAEYASDLMFMPVIRNEDTITDSLIKRGINCIGAEVLFKEESAPVASEKYINSMHKKGLVLFANAIVYNRFDVLSAGHSDDNSIIKSPDQGWGWLIDRGFDIIQTDWCGTVYDYIHNRNK